MLLKTIPSWAETGLEKQDRKTETVAEDEVKPWGGEW